MAEGTVTPIPLTDTGHYFTIAEFRASDPAFASSTEFPDLAVDAARAWAEARGEDVMHHTWFERTYTYRDIGDGGLRLFLPHRDLRAVSAVSIDGVALTADELAALVVYPHGMVKRYAGWTYEAAITVTYTHGDYDPIPVDLKQAMILLAQWAIVPKNLRQNAIGESTDVGFLRNSYATVDGKIGPLEVDAVFGRHKHTVVNIG